MPTHARGPSDTSSPQQRGQAWCRGKESAGRYSPEGPGRGPRFAWRVEREDAVEARRDLLEALIRGIQLPQEVQRLRARARRVYGARR